MSAIRCRKCGGLISGFPERTYDPLCSCSFEDEKVVITVHDFETQYISRSQYDYVKSIITQLRAEVAALRDQLDAANALVHEQDVIYMGHYRTVQEIRKATEELFAFIEAHADKKFLAHASALMDFRARIMPSNFPNSAALASHEARINEARKGGEK